MPPIMKVNYGGTMRREGGQNALKQLCFVPRPANQSVEAESDDGRCPKMGAENTSA